MAAPQSSTGPGHPHPLLTRARRFFRSRNGRLLAGILLAAALLRLLFLDAKPAHFDEGVNGWFVDQMTRTGYFAYDPENYHGPLHFYLQFLAQTLFGRNLWAFRMPVVLASIGCVWGMWMFRRFIGQRAATWAAAAAAVSPGAVFYGRYAIHETWLVFFLMMLTWGLLGLWKNGDRRSLWAVALGFTGVVLTKETYIIHVGTMIIAAACLWLLERFSRSQPRTPIARQRWSRRDLAATIIVSIALIVFFYSGTFMNRGGLTGLYEFFAKWHATGAEGAGHDKATYTLSFLPKFLNYYWLALFTRYEIPAIVGFAFSLRYLLPGHRLARYLAITGCGVLFAYSIIEYKTPWCITAMLWPFHLLFGLAIVQLSRWRFPFIATIVGAAILITSTIFAIGLNFRRATDPREPYVYVQTLPDVNKLLTPLKQLAAQNPAAYHLPGHVILDSYHPLPWLLGDFTAIGYYDETLPDEDDAAFLIVDLEHLEEIELTEAYFADKFQLRDGQGEAQLFLSARHFRHLFPGRSPEFQPDEEEDLE